MSAPTFTIEKDEVGLGSCVIVTWPDGKRIVVTGFGDDSNAQDWINQDSARWLKNIPEQFSGDQWINNRLPRKAD
jgi:hypothetical protein